MHFWRGFWPHWIVWIWYRILTQERVALILRACLVLDLVAFESNINLRLRPFQRSEFAGILVLIVSVRHWTQSCLKFGCRYKLNGYAVSWSRPFRNLLRSSRSPPLPSSWFFTSVGEIADSPDPKNLSPLHGQGFSKTNPRSVTLSFISIECSIANDSIR